jgi:probable rRNA maturation factor
MTPSRKHKIEVIGAPKACPPTLLRRFTSEVLNLCASPPTELTIAFVDEAEIRRLNLQFRGIDSPTDVLSFPLGDKTPKGLPYLGDVAVCLPVAERQAAELGHSLLSELLILTAHGIIHLCGHDHESDAGEMEALELQARNTIQPRYCAE